MWHSDRMDCSRTVRFLAIGVASLIGLAACSPLTPKPASGGAAPAATPAANGQAAEAGGPCASGSISVDAQEDASSGASTRKVDLVVTNTGSAPCSLTGYPGVVFAASGVQIGRPVVESSRVAEATTVSLGPGASAVATLHIIDPSALTSCKEEDFTEIWVSLAAEDDTIGVDFSGKTCSNTTNANIDPYQAR